MRCCLSPSTTDNWACKPNKPPFSLMQFLVRIPVIATEMTLGHTTGEGDAVELLGHEAWLEKMGHNEWSFNVLSATSSSSVL